MKSILFIISVGLLYLISSCASHKKIISSKDLKEYYYPTEYLKKPVIYHYKSDEELNEDMFWSLSKENDNGVPAVNISTHSQFSILKINLGHRKYIEIDKTIYREFVKA